MFRPCIDLHEGKVKQIVGGTLTDGGARTNFVSDQSAASFAERYKHDDLPGGHVIMLGPNNDEQRFTRKALEKMAAQGLLRTADSSSALQRASDELIRRRQ